VSDRELPSPADVDVAIRQEPPAPKRLSRKVLLGGGVIVGASVAIALLIGLSPTERNYGAREAVAASAEAPESIEGAAAQYAPYDLDRTWGDASGLDAENAELTPPQDPNWSGAPEGARQGPPNSAPATEAPAPPPAPLVFARAAATPEADDGQRLSARLSPPRSRFELMAGAVIPAALITELNSDLPGQVIAQVTQPVFDTVTGTHLLIPQGARLIGAHEGAARYGDRRVMLVWRRLILPNGWSMPLDAMPGADPAGAIGLSDRTDNHLDRLAVGIGLSALISVVANNAEDDEDNGSLARDVGDAAAEEAARSGGRIVDRELSVRPTLRVRVGAPVRVLVTRDIVLRPYRSAHD
jgi:type IV secretion system protein VirB10